MLTPRRFASLSAASVFSGAAAEYPRCAISTICPEKNQRKSEQYSRESERHFACLGLVVPLEWFRINFGMMGLEFEPREK